MRALLPLAISLFSVPALAVPMLALLESGSLVRFDSANPSGLIATRVLTGLAANDRAVGMAVRPGLLQLVILTRDVNGGPGKLYAVDPETGGATLLSTLTPAPGEPSDAAVLEGTVFALDVDPLADVLHVVIDSTKPLRVKPESGEVHVDADLLPYPAGDPSASATPPVLGAMAFHGAQRFAIDLERKVLATITGNELTTVGSLNVAVAGQASFDVSSSGVAYAAMKRGDVTEAYSRLYTVALDTGAATEAGPIGGSGTGAVSALVVFESAVTFEVARQGVPEGGEFSVDVVRRGDRRGAATVEYELVAGSALIPSDVQPISGTLQFGTGDASKTITLSTESDVLVEGPEAFRIQLSNPVNVPLGAPSSVQIQISDDDGARAWLAAADGRLIEIDFVEPGTIVREVPLTGLGSGETIRAIDARPSSRVLYAVTDDSRLYRLDTTNGAASEVASFPALEGSHWSADFEPIRDRLRVLTEAGRNLELNPEDGGVSEGAALHFASGDSATGTPAIAAMASTRYSLPSPPGRGFFGIDRERASLVRFQESDGGLRPEAGRLVTVGELGLAVPLTGEVAFDVSPTAEAPFLVANGSLYGVSLASGEALEIGALPDGVTAAGFTVALDPQVQFLSPTATVSEVDGVLRLQVVRQGVTQTQVSVEFTTVSGTAISGEDFTGTSGTLRFDPGELQKTLEIDVFADAKLEPDPEQFEVVLSANDPSVLGRHTRVTVSLHDFDGRPGLRVSDVQAYEVRGEAGFDVKLNAATSNTVRVRYDTVSGTAMAGEDFEHVTGTLVFAPGETLKRIAVPLIQTPSDPEPIETFSLVLKLPVGAALSDPEGVATVLETEGGDFTLELSSAWTRPGEQVTVTVAPTTQEIATAVELSCADLPPGLRCEFFPARMTPGFQPAKSWLRVSEERSFVTPAAGFLVLLTLLLRGRWRRQWQLGAVIGLTLAGAGCSGDGLPEGRYAIRVIAKHGGGVQQEAPLTVIVSR